MPYFEVTFRSSLALYKEFMASTPSSNLQTWLKESVGVTEECFVRLTEYGCDSIAMLSACTESDIEEIAEERNIQKIDKLKLKVAIRKLIERDANKHLIIESEERNIMMGIEDEIESIQNRLDQFKGQTLDFIKSEHSKCKQEINTVFQKLRESLDKRHSVLLERLSDIVENETRKFEHKSAMIHEDLQKSMEIKQQCHKLLHKPIECHQLQHRKQTLQQKADEISNLQQADHHQNGRANRGFVTFTSLYSSLLKIHDNFGRVRRIEYNDSDEWDLNIKGDDMVINGAACINRADNEYQTAFGRAVAVNGVHRWKLEVVRTTYHMLWFA